MEESNEGVSNRGGRSGGSGGRGQRGGRRGGRGGRRSGRSGPRESPSTNDSPTSDILQEGGGRGGRGRKDGRTSRGRGRGKSREKSPKGPMDTPSSSIDSGALGSLSTTTQSPSIPPSQPQQTSDINYGRSQAITVLHVAEKPSIAQAIANGLAQGSTKSSKGKSLPVHEFTGPDFPKAPHASSCTHRVTSVAGHVFALEFTSEFQSWDSVDPAELFTAKTIRKPCQGSVVKHLQAESRNVDFIVLWMDCDREGENINFEVLSICQNLMKTGSSSSNYDRVYRAYFSAINPSDIQKAYKVLGKPDQNQALSVDARQELDLKVGVAFSRFQTRYFQGRYGDLDSAVLSYGPCQTPTLGFCVQRYIDIETFKSEPYWFLELAINKRARSLKAQWDSGRSFNKNHVLQMVDSALENGPVAKVTAVITKEKKQGRPLPLNTVGLLKACSKALGIGPHAAMQTAERLYLSGYLSYPRTESTAYPKSFDIKGMLQEQISDSRWGSYVRQLLSSGGVTKARGGVDMGDHPPITPCRSARGGELSGDMARIYEFVVRHCIASVSQDAVWKSTRVNFAIEALGDKGKFTLRGKELLSPGFLAVLLHKEYEDDDDRDDDDNGEEEGVIPEFTEGELIPLVSPKSDSNSSKVSVGVSGTAVIGNLNVKERMTTAPGYLTESELIGMMEKHGIGTDASIPSHIQNIQNRNYVTLESGRRLIPSRLGLVLVQGYHRIDSSLVLPQVRSDIENQCNKIAKGFAGKDEVVDKAVNLFREKFDFFVHNVDKMDVLFGASFSKLEEVGKPFTRCGLTRRYLSFIPGPPVRLYNKYTETVYPLPAGGEVKQLSGRYCPVEGCKFELCMYSVGQPPRTFPLCPRCYNDPDWALDADEMPSDPVEKEDEGKERKIQRLAGKNLVLECPLPDEHPVIDEMAVSVDPDTEGLLILDPHLGPKWRLVSTRAPNIVYFPKSISKITILDQKDDELGVHLIKVEFKDGESPLPDKAQQYICCLPNDKILQPLIRVFRGTERTKIGRQGGRGGRGRGRGRGGRGRGRSGRK